MEVVWNGISTFCRYRVTRISFPILYGISILEKLSEFCIPGPESNIGIIYIYLQVIVVIFQIHRKYDSLPSWFWARAVTIVVIFGTPIILLKIYYTHRFCKIDTEKGEWSNCLLGTTIPYICIESSQTYQFMCLDGCLFAFL